MSTASDLAESLSASATFVASSIGTGVISFALFQTESCSGGGPLDDGPVTCQNVFGMAPMTVEAAATAGTVAGVGVGFLLWGLRELVLDHARSRGEQL